MTTKINQTKEIKVIEGTDYTKFDTNLVSISGIVHKGSENEDNITIEQQYNPVGYNIEDTGDYLSINFYVGGWGNFCGVGDFKKSESKHLIYDSIAWLTPEEGRYECNVSQIRIYKDRRIAIIAKSKSGRFYIMDKDKHSEEVFSNEEIKAKALTFTKKLFTSNSYYLINNVRVSDLRKKTIFNLHRYEYADAYKFAEETQRIVENFLDFNSPENKEIKEIWLKEVKPAGICSLSLMYKYICENLKKKNDIKKSKKQIFEELIEEAGMKDIFDNPQKYKGKIFWNRVGNEIVAFYTTSPSWKNGDYAHFFSFNTKTKKKKYGEYSYSLKDWNFPVASLKYVNDNFDVSSKEIIILNNLSVKELFAGTNCEWVLTYAPNYLYRRAYADDNEGLLSELISEKKMTEICLGILMSTAEPILELLLQAKLFNLYFICLSHKMGIYGNNFHFEEVDLATSLEKNSQWDFPYYKKGTNLKKMTGICVTNLRVLDSKLNYKFVEGDRYSRDHWERENINFALFKLFFDKDLLTADSQLFERSLDRWIKWKKENNNNWYLREIADLLEDKMDFDEKLDYISSYKGNYGNGSLLKDYLTARSKLEALSKSKPELANIFSKKEYPFAPKKAIKFFRYIPEEHGSTDSFMRQYTNKYREAYERGDFEFNFPKQATERKGSDLLGCTVVLTPREHLSFLHDKATYWVSFYQDAGKEEEFAKAVERVKPLEWEDKESGLCIVAPKKVADIRREGDVLSHCVATYVDPIINGTENIMLLRRMDMPNHPFFTVDVSNVGDIRQVHCYRNLCLTAEDQQRAYDYSEYEVYNKTFDIVGFLLKWAKAMKGKIKASSIHEQYGALCAQR